MSSAGTPGNKPRTNRKRKVARTFRLTPGKVEAAQRILGVATATDAIETALDMVVFREELIAGTRAAHGLRITSPDATRGRS